MLKSKKLEEIEIKGRGIIDMWYCAHAIFYFEIIGEDQESYLVHENIYLIYSENEEILDAIADGVAISNQDLSTDGHLELDEKKARYIFAGIRKIIKTETMPADKIMAASSGMELSYSIYEVDSIDEVRKLAAGEMVNLLYRE
ncbi:hypothetical protein [Delftia acidovorans]|uniref:hypothetical protein n=1 Tax=Delftia acidovorans TaxID=80866 RepID=UPI00192B9F20|nr:hypothetical protein [Delftia acidovorans]